MFITVSLSAEAFFVCHGGQTSLFICWSIHFRDVAVLRVSMWCVHWGTCICMLKFLDLIDLKHLPQSLSTFLLRQSCSLYLEPKLIHQADLPVDLHVLLSPPTSPEITQRTSTPSFSVWVLESKPKSSCFPGKHIIDWAISLSLSLFSPLPCPQAFSLSL